MSGGIFPISNEPHEIEVPAQRETFEAQVLVMTKPYKRLEYPISAFSYTIPFEQTGRVIESGNYKLELVMSHVANGKPTLIIYEEERV